MAVCKKCGNKNFPTLSELRKHQWKEHYKDTLGIRHTKEITVREVIEQNAPEMSARELLEKITEQRDFMNDVVHLIEGIINK